jgi:hypothetical protein
MATIRVGQHNDVLKDWGKALSSRFARLVTGFRRLGRADAFPRAERFSV